jgi:hypothetical protein
VASANHVLSYIATDKTAGLYDVDIEMVRVNVHSEPVHHLAAINRLLSTAAPAAWGYDKVESGLHYFVIDSECEAEIPFILGRLCGMRSAAYFVNEFKRIQAAYYPFILSFQQPEDIFRFYNGDICILIVVDLDYVEAEFARHGYVFQHEGLDFPWQVTQLGSEASGRFSHHFVSRLAAEFLSLDWMITEMITRYSRISGDGQLPSRSV